MTHAARTENTTLFAQKRYGGGVKEPHNFFSRRISLHRREKACRIRLASRFFYAHLGFCKEAAKNFLNFFKAKLEIHGISGHCQNAKGLLHRILAHCRSAKAVHTQFLRVVGVQKGFYTEFRRIVSVQKAFHTEFVVVVGLQKPVFTQNEACIGFHKQKRAFWRGIFMGGLYDKTFF